MHGLPVAGVRVASLPEGAEFHLDDHGTDIIRMVRFDPTEGESGAFLVRNERTWKEFYIDGMRVALPTQ